MKLTTIQSPSVRSAVWQWGLLIGLAGIITVPLKMLAVPAALLLGPMLAGVVFGVAGGTARLPAVPYRFSQATVGCLMASSITLAILTRFLQQWILFTVVLTAVIAAAAALGWLLCRFRVLPGTTAVWGLLPGAASTMMLMSEEYGADMRLVAFMQYLRVLFVVLAGALTAHFWVHASGGASAAAVWFPALHLVPLVSTLGIILAGVVLGPWTRLPAGSMLLPIILGTVLNLTGAIRFELPSWLLAAGYLGLGLGIGLRFTRPILVCALRTLPQVVLAILTLMAFCAGLAWLLVTAAGVDPLTAYLATSPGGADSIVVIAASSQADLPFVMTMQMMRFLVVLLIGPPLAAWLARHAAKDAK